MATACQGDQLQSLWPQKSPVAISLAEVICTKNWSPRVRFDAFAISAITCALDFWGRLAGPQVHRRGHISLSALPSNKKMRIRRIHEAAHRIHEAPYSVKNKFFVSIRRIHEGAAPNTQTPPNTRFGSPIHEAPPPNTRRRPPNTLSSSPNTRSLSRIDEVYSAFVSRRIDEGLFCSRI